MFALASFGSSKVHSQQLVEKKSWGETPALTSLFPQDSNSSHTNTQSTLFCALNLSVDLLEVWSQVFDRFYGRIIVVIVAIRDLVIHFVSTRIPQHEKHCKMKLTHGLCKIGLPALWLSLVASYVAAPCKLIEESSFTMALFACQSLEGLPAELPTLTLVFCLVLCLVLVPGTVLTVSSLQWELSAS